MKKKSPIIITGIHRSGTSLLTRIIENNSVFFGESKDINQESLFFQNINKWIMSINSSTWDNPKTFIDSIDNESHNMILNKICRGRSRLLNTTRYGSWFDAGINGPHI